MAISAGPIAVRVVKEGLSARAGLALARAAGVQIRDATWYRIVSEAKRSLTAHVVEAARPLARKPLGEEISTMTTRNARGYVQYVEVYARDHQTGLITTHPFAIRSTSLITRQRAVDKALDAMTTSTASDPEQYDETILFALYTATYQMIPGLD